ncbi:MAG: radical SAM protein [Thermodesulfobacteriota bacterium]|nr:radical SAM protein [Thermodesulfobacteriota bacterium]
MPQQSAFTRFVIRNLCDLAARCLGGDRTYHGHWIYEKLHKPSSVCHETINVLYYILKTPKLHRPIAALIEPVYGCNLNCTYCWPAFKQQAGIRGPIPERPHLMPWNLFRKTVEQLPRSVESVCLTGLGEPLLHPRLMDMIKFLAKRHIRSIIYTNGTLLHGPMATRLARSPVDVVNISTEPDSNTAMTYRGMDIRALYNHIAAFISAKRPETEIKLSVVAHPGNVDQLQHLYRRWHRATDGIKIVHQVSFSRSVPAHKCPEPWLGNINILTNGDVGICCLAPAWPVVIGNITTQPLDVLLNGPRHRAILNAFIHKTHLPGPCQFCLQFNEIKGRKARGILK